MIDINGTYVDLVLSISIVAKLSSALPSFIASITSTIASIKSAIASAWLPILAIALVAVAIVGIVCAIRMVANLLSDAAKTRSAVNTAVKSKGIDSSKLRNYSVYVIVEKATLKTYYVGMTKNFFMRRDQHKRSGKLTSSRTMLAIATNLDREEARALEQSLINAFSIESLSNVINSISKKNGEILLKNLIELNQLFQVYGMVSDMGFWGTKLYQNDYTLDIRDAFVELIKRKNIDETTAIIYNDFYNDDPNYEPLFWYAISDVRKEYGFLDDITLQKVIEWIDRGGGINLWETKKQKENWIIELSKLKTKLLDNTIPIKKIKKREIFNHHPWEIGDLIAYKFNSDLAKRKGFYGRYIVFQKIDNCLAGHNDYVDDDEFTFSKVIFLNYIFDSIPSIEEINVKSILPFVDKYVSETELTAPDIVKLYEKNIIIINNKRAYLKNRFYVLGNKKIFYNCSDNHYGDIFLNTKFEEDIIYFLEIWGK